MRPGRAEIRLSLVALAVAAFAVSSPAEALHGQLRGQVSWPATPAAEGEGGARPPWQAPAAALVLPGSGQLLLGQRRGWGYLALEALVWTGYTMARSQGLEDRRAYRDLAWQVARTWSGSRVDGDFAYYERMSKWLRSGAFDADPATPGVQPEEDPATFNGDAWRLASAIFMGGSAPGAGSPGYSAALAYYQERAYGDPYLWDWRGRMKSLESFRRLIEDSDTHLRNASLILGGAVVNRLASAADAFFSQRVGLDAEVRVEPRRWPGIGRGFTPFLRIRMVLP